MTVVDTQLIPLLDLNDTNENVNGTDQECL